MSKATEMVRFTPEAKGDLNFLKSHFGAKTFSDVIHEFADQVRGSSRGIGLTNEGKRDIDWLKIYFGSQSYDQVLSTVRHFITAIEEGE